MDDASKSAAKLALHLLKQPDGTAAAAPPPPAAEAAPPAAPRCALARADSSTPAAAASTARVSLRGVVSDAPPAGGEEAAAPGAAAAADALDSLVQLLEQYYHPSNGGSWTPDLAVFLRQVGTTGVYECLHLSASALVRHASALCTVCWGLDCRPHTVQTAL